MRTHHDLKDWGGVSFSRKEHVQSLHNHKPDRGQMDGLNDLFTALVVDVLLNSLKVTLCGVDDDDGGSVVVEAIINCSRLMVVKSDRVVRVFINGFLRISEKFSRI